MKLLNVYNVNRKIKQILFRSTKFSQKLILIFSVGPEAFEVLSSLVVATQVYNRPSCNLANPFRKSHTVLRKKGNNDFMTGR